MKIFWPVMNQLPASSRVAVARSAAMSLPASGSVMSMLPQARPLAISAISSRQRVFTIRPVAGSRSVVPSNIDSTIIASAMAPWKPLWTITDASARPSSSPHT